MEPARSPPPAIAVCGVATPSEFAASLVELGVSPEERLEFRDHQRYGPRPLAEIRRGVEAAGASVVLTTEKDAVKLAGLLPVPILTVRLSVEVAEAGFFPFVSSRLRPETHAMSEPRAFAAPPRAFPHPHRRARPVSG